jgi:hypothetical protein
MMTRVAAALALILWANGPAAAQTAAMAFGSSPARVTLPAAWPVTRVSAGGHGTMLRSSDGALYACGDNEEGSLGIGSQIMVSVPTTVPVTATALLALAGAHAAVSADGCAVRLAGDNESGIVGASSRVFVVRPTLSLCGARPVTPVATSSARSRAAAYPAAGRREEKRMPHWWRDLADRPCGESQTRWRSTICAT